MLMASFDVVSSGRKLKNVPTKLPHTFYCLNRALTPTLQRPNAEENLSLHCNLVNSWIDLLSR